MEQKEQWKRTSVKNLLDLLHNNTALRQFTTTMQV